MPVARASYIICGKWGPLFKKQEKAFFFFCSFSLLPCSCVFNLFFSVYVLRHKGCSQFLMQTFTVPGALRYVLATHPTVSLCSRAGGPLHKGGGQIAENLPQGIEVPNLWCMLCSPIRLHLQNINAKIKSFRTLR